MVKMKEGNQNKKTQRNLMAITRFTQNINFGPFIFQQTHF
jgi:hypothetical protein